MSLLAFKVTDRPPSGDGLPWAGGQHMYTDPAGDHQHKSRDPTLITTTPPPHPHVFWAGVLTLRTPHPPHHPFSLGIAGTRVETAGSPLLLLLPLGSLQRMGLMQTAHLPETMAPRQPHPVRLARSHCNCQGRPRHWSTDCSCQRKPGHQSTLDCSCQWRLKHWSAQPQLSTASAGNGG